jgi:hypothetical protein
MERLRATQSIHGVLAVPCGGELEALDAQRAPLLHALVPTCSLRAFQRTSTSGTQNMIGATIGVPSTQWQGVMHSSTGSMLAALVAAGKDDAGIPDESIGILVAGSADTNRSTIRVLAFQDEG